MYPGSASRREAGRLALRKAAAGPGIELVSAPPPQAPGPHDVVVEVAYAGICGTDLHVDDWYPAYHFMASRLPVTLGHEFSGRILQMGSRVTGLSLGDLVVVRPSVTCGECVACQQGNHDGCRDRRGIGLTSEGAFAPSVTVPGRNCVPLPPGLSAEVAALAEPFSIAWRAVERGLPAVEDSHAPRVLVLGPGIIGQAIALLARSRGAHVSVAGKQDAVRCGLLRAVGFQDVADFAEPAGEAAIASWGPFDLIFEATGSPESIASVIGKLAFRGTLVVTGIHPRPLTLDLTAVVRNEWTIAGSFRPAERIWPLVLKFLAENQALVRPLITHCLPLVQAQEGFDLSRSRQAGKVLLTPRMTA